jgi:hypothetical protein
MPQPVESTYLKLLYTGGTNNSDPLLSLGGAYGQEFIFDPQQYTLDQLLENLFPNVRPEEQVAGKVRYRAIGIKNSHPDGTMYFFTLKMTKPVGDTVFYFGWAPEDINTPPQQIETETQEPSNVTWVGVNVSSQLPEVHLGPGEIKGLWIKQVIPAGASDQPYEYPQLRFTWGAVGA